MSEMLGRKMPSSSPSPAGATHASVIVVIPLVSLELVWVSEGLVWAPWF